MTSIHHSIIGLPKSGKTTFLAALWHLFNAGEVSTKLALDRLVGDLQHLNGIVDIWRRCEQVPRTSIAAETSVSIHVLETVTGREVELIFPDLSGESFELQLKTRSCRSSYLEAFKGHGGVLLFVTADRPLDGLTINDLDSAVEGLDEPDHPGPQREWMDQMVPEQVRLVQLLQFLQQAPFERRRRRIAVIVSAWDLVAMSQRPPLQWLEQELPLLHQFLRSNVESFEWRVYGVSAQGGDFTGADRDNLARITPSERIICIGPEADRHDLTSPILWLTEEG